MVLSSLIAAVDSIKPNAFSNTDKTAWVNECEGLVQTEVMLLAAEDVVQYDYATDAGVTLLVKPPHDKLYRAYLVAMIDFANGEYNKYQNTMVLCNQYLGEYMRWYARNYRPADGAAIDRGYYLSAYGIAVAHGYAGTEAQWLESLRGAGVNMRYDSDVLQWKRDDEEAWKALVDIEDIRGPVVTQTLTAASASAAAAKASETAAATTAAAAAGSAAAAATSKQNAAASATAAATSEQNAAGSVTAAAASKESAAGSATAAAAAKEAAAGSATAAQTAQEGAAGSATAAATSEGKAADSAVQAAGSATLAGASEQNATGSATVAAASKESAAGSATAAATAAGNAAGSAAAAATSEQNAAGSATAAQAAREGAATSATAASTSKAAAASSAASSESWAVGGTGTRTGENTNNSKYWSEQAHAAAGGGVSSFNGRSGAVTPAAGDYTPAQVGAAATVHGHVSAQITDADQAPVAESGKLVISGGVYAAIAAKADKVVPAANENVAVLSTDGSLKDSGWKIDVYATNHSVVKRTAAGRIIANDPSGDTDVVTKGYLDTAMALKAEKSHAARHRTGGEDQIHQTEVVPLTVSGWASNSITVSVTSATANNTIFVSPMPASFGDYSDAGIYCSAQAAGSLTFTCSTTPTVDISVNVAAL